MVIPSLRLIVCCGCSGLCRRWRALEAETLAAAAGCLDVRVVELKQLLQTVAHVIEFCAIKKAKAFRVYDQLRAVVFADLITPCRRVASWVWICFAALSVRDIVILTAPLPF